MTVIAMGSGGNKIAQGGAKKLKLAMVHYEVIDHLSDRSRVRPVKVVHLRDPKDDPDRELTSLADAGYSTTHHAPHSSHHFLHTAFF